MTHSTRCIVPADYPLQVEGAVGAFVEERPLICGGRSSIEDYHDDCFHYNIYNNRSVGRNACLITVKTWPSANPSFPVTSLPIAVGVGGTQQRSEDSRRRRS